MLGAVCECDVRGCTTPRLIRGTTLLMEADAVFAGWEVIAGVVRCPACQSADRWPEATVGGRAPGDPTATPWVDGPEQGAGEPVALAPLEPGYLTPAAVMPPEPRTVTDDDEI